MSGASSATSGCHGATPTKSCSARGWLRCDGSFGAGVGGVGETEDRSGPEGMQQRCFGEHTRGPSQWMEQHAAPPSHQLQAQRPAKKRWLLFTAIGLWVATASIPLARRGPRRPDCRTDSPASNLNTELPSDEIGYNTYPTQLLQINSRAQVRCKYLLEILIPVRPLIPSYLCNRTLSMHPRRRKATCHPATAHRDRERALTDRLPTVRCTVQETIVSRHANYDSPSLSARSPLVLHCVNWRELAATSGADASQLPIALARRRETESVVKLSS